MELVKNCPKKLFNVKLINFLDNENVLKVNFFSKCKLSLICQNDMIFMELITKCKEI